MYLKQKKIISVTRQVKKTLLIITLSIFGSYVNAQKVFVPDLAPNNTKAKGVDIDSLKAIERQKLNTSTEYDVSELFNLDLSESERAQAKAIIEVFTEQIQEDTSDISAYINRGSYWATLGLHVQAIKDYDRALLIDDQQPIIYYNRALSKARFFYTYDACLDLKKSRDLGLMQANKLMMQQCTRHLTKLNSASVSSVSK
jgi:tetratricopeptide (TPR) repeat protein